MQFYEGPFNLPIEPLIALWEYFPTGGMFTKISPNTAFIAEHGSWKRSKKSGYKISMVKMENGLLLISDDFYDAIYRVTYIEPL